MNNIQSPIIKFPLITPYTVIITLLFMISKYMGLIDWDIIWIFSPLWIPSAIALLIMIWIWICKSIIYLLDYIRFKRKFNL